ncbi:MAG: hypothetical protein F6K53_06925 [Moorea sp. SIO4A1]|nr:hypothetical protein [Moorena sp. SIO4A1]NEQ57159.1 hypothetical protein [Moorena sp. SIO4A1]
MTVPVMGTIAVLNWLRYLTLGVLGSRESGVGSRESGVGVRKLNLPHK